MMAVIVLVTRCVVWKDKSDPLELMPSEISIQVTLSDFFCESLNLRDARLLSSLKRAMMHPSPIFIVHLIIDFLSIGTRTLGANLEYIP